MTEKQFHEIEEKFSLMKQLERESNELNFAISDLANNETTTIRIRSGVFDIDDKETMILLESMLRNKLNKLKAAANEFNKL